MPTPTYVAIAKTVLTGTQATVTFSSIASTYTDLVILISARSSAASYVDNAYLTVNGNAANYSFTYLNGNGATASTGNVSGSSSTYSPPFSAASATANTFGNVEIYIPNYLVTSGKPMSGTGVAESNSSTANQSRIGIFANLWNDTAAINSISLQCISGSFVSGSRFDLYGIKNS